jgi:thiol-disulfide isomerase/thioredoxin
MFKKIFIPVFIALFLISCQSGEEDAKNFSKDYILVTAGFKVLRSEVKTRDEYAAYKADKKREYENLLEKYEKSPNIEEIEILRSKVLLNLESLDEADKKIDNVLANDPDSITEAKMVKVKIQIEKQDFGEAYNVFKDIEAQVTDLSDRFEAYYYIGTEHDDNKVRLEYANKFLNAEEIPEEYAKKKAIVYLSLASVAKQENDFDKARKLLNEGIAATDNAKRKKLLEKTIEQLDFVGKEAFPISAKTWVNSTPLELQNMKGRVVVVAFWAPWCPSCRSMLPSLKDLYQENKDQEFTIIGYTRLYGKYRDDVEDLGKVNKDEEIEHIKKYMERNNIKYPVAIAEETNDYQSYNIAGIPTLIFIDKKGNIDYTKIGSGSSQFIKNKVKNLLTDV